MSLLPKSLKTITRAPQLPENKGPFSPDPQNPWGPQQFISFIDSIQKYERNDAYMYVVLIEYTCISRTDLSYHFHVSSNSNSEFAYFTLCAYFTLEITEQKILAVLPFPA